MKLKYGNLWDSTDEVILVTANSYITKDGRLVMGRGAALEMKNRFPGIDKFFGDGLRSYHLKKYGLCIKLPEFFGNVDNIATKYYGIFQVKYNFKDKADLDLIKYSTEILYNHAIGVYSMYSISMNFPGIGFGGLNFADVLPIVSILPDNVTLYLRGEDETQ